MRSAIEKQSQDDEDVACVIKRSEIDKAAQIGDDHPKDKALAPA
jgi:hypothetical protein